MTPARLFAAAFATATLVACRPEPTEPPELDPGEHLLLTPRGNPDELLGRTVTPAPDGGYIVSDERPAGCDVTVRRVPERWQRSYQQEIGRAAYIGTGKTPVGELTAQHGKTIRVDAQIDNLEVLQADLRGCTGTVVSSVKVGSGKREFLAREETKVDAKVRTKAGPVGAGGGKWRAVGRALAWSEPQAWAFSVTDTAGTNDMRVELILLPEQVHDGESFSLKILSAKEVYIVIVSVGGDGKASILAPNAKAPMPKITAAGNVELTLQAKLAVPGQDEHNRVVVYAFSERGDFDMFKPPGGKVSSKAAQQWMDGLPERLAKIPTRRWAMTESTLQIVPAPPPPAPSPTVP